MNREKIKITLDTLYGEVFNHGKAELLSDLVSGPYIQHNPHLPNGIESLAGYVTQAGGIVNEVKRVAIDGDMAFVHVRFPDWMGAEHAAVDIFRFDEDGKILEHWDVLQGVPASAANINTMF